MAYEIIDLVQIGVVVHLLGALSSYYQSLRARGKHHLTAVGAVARKMCNIIYAVLRDDKPYAPAKFEKL